MDLDTLVRIFAALGLLPPETGLYRSSAAPPLGSTHIEPAGAGGAISPAMIARLRRVRTASTPDASASAASDASSGTADNSSSAPPLTAADIAGPVPRDGGLQDLTAGELAGPVAHEGGANPGATDGGLGGMMKILSALGLFTPDGNFNTLGVLGAALNGAAALGGDGRQAPPRIAPALVAGWFRRPARLRADVIAGSGRATRANPFDAPSVGFGS